MSFSGLFIQIHEAEAEREELSPATHPVMLTDLVLPRVHDEVSFENLQEKKGCKDCCIGNNSSIFPFMADFWSASVPHV